MKQRVVSLLAQYLEHRVRGRITGLRACGDDDFLVAIEDIRDGRTHLLHGVEDLRQWLMSFKTGECPQPATAICEVCDRLHSDRGPDGELLKHCIPCTLELIDIYTDLEQRKRN